MEPGCTVEFFTGGMLRIGPDHLKFGDPFDYPVVFAFRENGRVEIIGFNKENIGARRYRFIIRKINQFTGRLVDYWRKGKRPHFVSQKSMANGEIIMTKTHHVDEAKVSPGGKIDQAVALQHTLEACALMAAGKLLIVEMTQESAGPKRTKRTFVVEEA